MLSSLRSVLRSNAAARQNEEIFISRGQVTAQALHASTCRCCKAANCRAPRVCGRRSLPQDENHRRKPAARNLPSQNRSRGSTQPKLCCLPSSAMTRGSSSCRRRPSPATRSSLLSPLPTFPPWSCRRLGMLSSIA